MPSLCVRKYCTVFYHPHEGMLVIIHYSERLESRERNEVKRPDGVLHVQKNMLDSLPRILSGVTGQIELEFVSNSKAAERRIG